MQDFLIEVVDCEQDCWYQPGEKYVIVETGNELARGKKVYYTAEGVEDGHSYWIAAEDCKVLSTAVGEAEELELPPGIFPQAKDKSEDEGIFTGGSSDYYKIWVANPTTLDEPYMAECNDIIEALKMNFAEGNAFKALWRRAAARLGVRKKGYDGGKYDAEKVVFFGERLVIQSEQEGV